MRKTKPIKARSSEITRFKVVIINPGDLQETLTKWGNDGWELSKALQTSPYILTLIFSMRVVA